jgi:hypothetical protein
VNAGGHTQDHLFHDVITLKVSSTLSSVQVIQMGARMHVRYKNVITYLLSIEVLSIKYDVSPVHAMKTHRGNRGIAPLILNLSTRFK